MSHAAYTHNFSAFNTVNTVSVYAKDQAEATALFAKIDALQARYERLFSRTCPQSELARINNAAGQKVTVDPELAGFIAQALGYCKRCEGLFDITMGSAVRLWDFKTGIIPGASELVEALKHVDYHAVHVDDDVVWLDDPQASIDLGGIAKGYIADKLLECMALHEVQGGLVNLGGNVAVFGDKPDGNAWKIGIRMPMISETETETETETKTEIADKVFAYVELPLTLPDTGSVVTSGIYERAFTHDGQLYHHILDPKTGYPAKTDLLGATIVSKTSLDGDGYTTALIIMGLDAAIKFVESRPELEAVFIKTDGSVYATTAIGQKIPFKLLAHKA